MFMKNINLNLKKNQMVIFFIAIMLIVVGYLNYSSVNNDESLESSIKLEEVAGIGDAKLVNSNAILEQGALVENNDDKEDKEKIKSNIINEKSIIETNAGEIEKIDEEEKENVNVNVNVNNEYYINSRLERDTMFSQMIESYQKILDNKEISADQKVVAQTEIKRINDLKNAIMISENLIKNKGFDDVIIFVNDKSINVIVRKDKLETDEIAQIQNIIIRELSSNIDNIHISTK